MSGVAKTASRSALSSRWGWWAISQDAFRLLCSSAYRGHRTTSGREYPRHKELDCRGLPGCLARASFSNKGDGRQFIDLVVATGCGG